MKTVQAPLVTLDGLADPSLPTVMSIPRTRAEMPKSGWLEWLEHHNRFRFENPSGGKFTAYKSPKGYWTAQRRLHGKLRHEYLGGSSDLTYEILDRTARKMDMGDSAYWREKYPDPRAEPKSNTESHNGKYETIDNRSYQTAAELENLKSQLAEAKKAIALLEQKLTLELQNSNHYRDRANQVELDGLRAATILNEALKLPANKGGAIKVKIRKALELIDDI